MMQEVTFTDWDGLVSMTFGLLVIMEVIIRMAFWEYGKGASSDDPWDAVNLLGYGLFMVTGMWTYTLALWLAPQVPQKLLALPIMDLLALLVGLVYSALFSFVFITWLKCALRRANPVLPPLPWEKVTSN